jgi:hypothetical protein
MGRTATETIMKVMEDFGEAEPEELMVIWTDAAGDLCWSATTDSKMVKLGMVEFVKSVIVRSIE